MWEMEGWREERETLKVVEKKVEKRGMLLEGEMTCHSGL